jgi:hypothetical protein
VRNETTEIFKNSEDFARKRKSTIGVFFLPWLACPEHPRRAEAAANLLTIDALDPQAKIPEFKACAVQVFPARDDELPNPDVVLERGRY